jgi:hypothetical protein
MAVCVPIIVPPEIRLITPRFVIPYVALEIIVPPEIRLIVPAFAILCAPLEEI